MIAAKIKTIKRSDWVRCKTTASGLVGFVKRVAADGSWADVNWHSHTKRMRTSALEVLTTIPLPGGWTVTDDNRAQELGRQP